MDRGEESSAQLSSPGFLSSPWLFTPFLVSPIPHISPTGPVVSFSPKKLHEVLEGGPSHPVWWLEGEEHAENSRPPGNVDLGCVLQGF